MTHRCMQLAAAVAAALVASGCDRKPAEPAAPAESADAFVERLNREVGDRTRELSAAGFAYATYINQDTEFLNAKANERFLEYFSGAVEQAKQYEHQQL